MDNNEEKKVYYPETIEEEPLPETLVWENIGNRPRSLKDLDPVLQEAFDNLEEDFLDLGTLAFLDSITTTEITDSAITTPKLAAGSVIASKLSVGSLSAITADLGTITSGTITGALIRTSATGARVEIKDTTDRISVYDSGDEERMRLDEDELTFYNEDGVERGSLYTDGLNMFFRGSIGGYMIFECPDDSPYGMIFTVDSVQKMAITDDGVTFSDQVTCVDRVQPATDNTEDLGSPSLIWNDIYVNDVNYNTLSVISDRRLKENIVDIYGGLEKVLALRPVSFKYKKKENQVSEENEEKRNKAEANLTKKAEITHLGFIAQEVQNILPEVVNPGTEETMASLRGTELIAVLVKAVQELNQKVEDIMHNN